ncbi:MAG: hypothetical protein AB3N64_08245 [Puniceicoccaceae bacterium]
MAEEKLRRKSFIVSLGAAALGMVGFRTGNNPPQSTTGSVNSGLRENERVRQDPRAVPCSSRKL